MSYTTLEKTGKAPLTSASYSHGFRKPRLENTHEFVIQARPGLCNVTTGERQEFKAWPTTVASAGLVRTLIKHSRKPSFNRCIFM